MTVEVVRVDDFPPGASEVFKRVVIANQEKVGEIDTDQTAIEERLTAVEEKNGEQDIAIQQNKTNIASNAEKNAEQDQTLSNHDQRITANKEATELNAQNISTNADNISENATSIESIKEVLEAVNGQIVGDKDVATVEKHGLVKQVLEASIVGPLNSGEQDPAVIVAKINEIATAWSAFVRYAFIAGIIKTENNSEDFQDDNS